MSVRPGPSLTDQVIAAIRDGVRAGTYRPGELYSVYQVAETLGVSRSPVREGLLRLAEAGLVRFSRNRGFEIVLPQPRDVAEIIAVRLALEVPAARRVCAAADEVRAEITTAYAAIERLAGEADEVGFWAADRFLHDLILRRAGNARAASIVASLRDLTALIGPPTSAGSRDLHAICVEHAPVVEAVARGDRDAADAAMCSHLINTGRLLVAQLATDSDAPDFDRLLADANV